MTTFPRSKRAADDHPVLVEKYGKAKKFILSDGPKFAAKCRDLATSRFVWVSKQDSPLVTFLRTTSAQASAFAKQIRGGEEDEDGLSDHLSDYASQSIYWVESFDDINKRRTKGYAIVAKGLQKVATLYDGFTTAATALLADVERADDQAQWILERCQKYSEKFDKGYADRDEVQEAIEDIKATLNDYRREYAPLIARLTKADKGAKSFVSALEAIDFGDANDISTPDESLLEDITSDLGDVESLFEEVFDEMAAGLKAFIYDFQDTAEFSLNVRDYHLADESSKTARSDEAGAERVARLFARVAS